MLVFSRKALRMEAVAYVTGVIVENSLLKRPETTSIFA